MFLFYHCLSDRTLHQTFTALDKLNDNFHLRSLDGGHRWLRLTKQKITVICDEFEKCCCSKLASNSPISLAALLPRVLPVLKNVKSVGGGNVTQATESKLKHFLYHSRLATEKVHTATYLFWSVARNYANIMNMHVYKRLPIRIHEQPGTCKHIIHKYLPTQHRIPWPLN